MRLKKEHIVILGGGESGVGAALLAKQKGYSVFLSDAGKIKSTYKNQLIAHEIEFEEEEHSLEKIFKADLVVKSPGIPKKAKIIVELREKKIPILSEIEFAARYAKAKIIAITGSNGKTTTTSLIYHLFKKAGFNVGLAGNIGNSFAYQVATENYEYYVLEVSSFQLDDCYEFKPFVSLFLNLSPDHLDEYEYDYDKYAQAKFKIAQKQSKEDFFIYNTDDPKIIQMLEGYDFEVQKLTFSTTEHPKSQAKIENNVLKISMNEDELFEMPIQDLSLEGIHNVANSMAAGLAAKVCKIKNTVIREGLSDFKGVPHRLQQVLTIQGIRFINDSKATNVNAVYFALDSMKTPIIWIVGGKDKGNDYSELRSLVQEKVKAIVCLGVDNSPIIDYFSDVDIPIFDTKSMKDAVRMAYKSGEKGDTVLLSPACASFDLFNNFEHRGNEFIQEVRNL